MAQTTVRNEEGKTSFSLGRSAESFVVSLLSDQLTHNLRGLSTLHNQCFPESKFRNERTGAVPRLDLGLQRLLYPSWAQESAGRMREVLGSVFVTLGCRQLQGNCHFTRPQSVYLRLRCPRLRLSSYSLSPSSFVSVFVCLCLRLSPSSPVSVFVYLRLRLSPS